MCKTGDTERRCVKTLIIKHTMATKTTLSSMEGFFRNNAFFSTHTSKHQVNNTNPPSQTEVTHSKSTQIDDVCAYKDEKLVQTFKALILPSTSSPMLSGASSTFWPSNSVSLAVQPPTLGQIQAPCKVPQDNS